jgi:hypothetical protein
MPNMCTKHRAIAPSTPTTKTTPLTTLTTLTTKVGRARERVACLLCRELSQLALVCRAFGLRIHGWLVEEAARLRAKLNLASEPRLGRILLAHLEAVSRGSRLEDGLRTTDPWRLLLVPGLDHVRTSEALSSFYSSSLRYSQEPATLRSHASFEALRWTALVVLKWLEFANRHGMHGTLRQSSWPTWPTDREHLDIWWVPDIARGVVCIYDLDEGVDTQLRDINIHIYEVSSAHFFGADMSTLKEAEGGVLSLAATLYDPGCDPFPAGAQGAKELVLQKVAGEYQVTSRRAWIMLKTSMAAAFPCEALETLMHIAHCGLPGGRWPLGKSALREIAALGEQDA